MGVVAAIRIRLTIARITLAPETKTRLVIWSNGIRNGYDGWRATDVPAGPHQRVHARREPIRYEMNKLML